MSKRARDGQARSATKVASADDSTTQDVPIRLVVPRALGGLRLDRVIADQLAARPAPPTRGAVQRWISLGHVSVNGRPGAAKDRVREGDVLVVAEPAPEATAARAEAGIPFRVLHMDDAVVVVVKPSGLVVHPAPGHASGTLVNGLLALGAFTDVRLEEGEFTRPGIVHRLDKGTSGVMVVARTAAARESLKKQFEVHSIERSYVAIARGDVRSETFDTLHGRHPTDRVKFSSRVRTGKRAVTHVERVESLSGEDETVSFVRCRLETGRTHQIRVHLADAGHAILGDPLYGKPTRDPVLRALVDRVGHQLLHAEVLGFVHPSTGESVRYTAPPPDDFQQALDELRSR